MFSIVTTILQSSKSFGIHREGRHGGKHLRLYDPGKGQGRSFVDLRPSWVTQQVPGQLGT